MDDLQATYSDDHDDVITTSTATAVVPPTTETLTLTPSLSISSEDDDIDIDNFVDSETEPEPKKLKSIEDVVTPLPPKPKGNKTSKKKSKGNNVWTKPASKRGKKRTKSVTASVAENEDNVLITPLHRLDRNDDSAETSVCLSKVYKAEKVELSEDRMSAGSCKGYRMVRATRGVSSGAWWFEIKVVELGESGHTRLGWCSEKGDLQAPVGYDGNSYGFRDVDGSKVHKAVRERYGDGLGYGEGDVVGFYVNLPDGERYAPKGVQLVLYKGQKYAYASDAKEEAPKVVPGSEICFFKNGICQGSAFKDLNGGRYYPAASMYTLPNQSNCVVKFNFGPDFEAFPEDFGERPIPRPMVEVPYHGFDGSIQNGIPFGPTRLCPMLKVVKENG